MSCGKGTMKKMDKADCIVKPIKPRAMSYGKGTMKKMDKSDCKVKPIKLRAMSCGKGTMKKMDKSDYKVKPVKPRAMSCGKGTMKKMDKSDCKVKPIKLEDVEELLEEMYPPFSVNGNRGSKEPKAAGGAFPLFKYCRFCGTEGDHLDHECSYLKFVPPGAKLGPNYTVACRCHHLLGGHPDRNDWKWYLIRRLDDEFVEYDTYCNKLEASVSDFKAIYGYEPPTSESKNRGYLVHRSDVGFHDYLLKSQAIKNKEKRTEYRCFNSSGEYSTSSDEDKSWEDHDSC